MPEKDKNYKPAAKNQGSHGSGNFYDKRIHCNFKILTFAIEWNVRNK